MVLYDLKVAIWSFALDAYKHAVPPTSAPLYYTTLEGFVKELHPDHSAPQQNPKSEIP
jgi:hypothetical protein